MSAEPTAKLPESLLECHLAKGLYQASRSVRAAIVSPGLTRLETDTFLATVLETLAMHQQQIRDLEKTVHELCEQARLK